ncbi:MAG: hypothetical protein ABIM99_04045 [Candidatus Dojkabacteria bacterium]
MTKLFTYTLLILGISLVFVIPVYAYNWAPSGNNILYPNGNVGIGSSATAPNDDLVVRNSPTTGKLLVGDGFSSWWIQGNNYGNTGQNNIGVNGYITNGWHKRNSSYEGWMMSTYVTQNNSGYFKIFHMDSANEAPVSMFAIGADGTTYVRGLKVSIPPTGWPDNVFSSDYKLMPLSEVESYIKENKHLPDVKSEEELLKDGLDIGEMQQQQMKKIEELTLYIIELQKEVKELKTGNK